MNLQQKITKLELYDRVFQRLSEKSKPYIETKGICAHYLSNNLCLRGIPNLLKEELLENNELKEEYFQGNRVLLATAYLEMKKYFKLLDSDKEIYTKHTEELRDQDFPDNLGEFLTNLAVIKS